MQAPHRYVTPVSPAQAGDRTAGVYAQLASDFGYRRAPTFLALSPAPDLLAGTWALVRESLLAGAAPRIGKEVVAAGVSVANRCPFCLGAHAMLLHATGAHHLAETIARGEPVADPDHARLLAWAQATRVPGAPELSAPPFPAEHAAGYVGTALAFHFINRIVSALLTDATLAGNAQHWRVVRSLAGRTMSRVVHRSLPAGRSLPLLAGLPAGPVPAWGAGTPVGTAYAVLAAAAAAGGALLREPARATVAAAVAGWDGSHPPLAGWPGGLLDALPAADRPAARLALLAALAPYRITDRDVADWRAGGGTDPDLVRLIGFGAGAATARIESLVTVAWQPVTGR